MRLIRYIDDVPAALKGCVVALGNFDGLHRGHQAVIGKAKALAHKKNVPLAVMTFEPHPRAFFTPNQDAFRLSPFRIKCRQMRIMGVDFLYVQRFNAAFSSNSADVFVDKFLIDGLQVSHVVVGYDFTFGARAAGDCETLRALGAELDFTVESVAALEADGAAVSSTRLRAAVAAGDMRDAETLL